MLSSFPNSRWILLSLSLLILAGCKSESIEGNWEATDGRPFALEFRGDGTMDLSINAMGQSLKIPGKYTYSRGALVITDMEVPTMLSAAISQSPFAQGAEFPKDIRATVTYKNEQEIVINGKTMIDGAYKKSAK